MVKGHPLSFAPDHSKVPYSGRLCPNTVTTRQSSLIAGTKCREYFRTMDPERTRSSAFREQAKQFYVLAADRVVDLHLTGDTQCLPLYRYTEDGERVSNITEWGLRQFREHYGDDDITAEDVFAYTYAALHDPAYRETYAVDLRREFPRLPFHDDFPSLCGWARNCSTCTSASSQSSHGA